MTVQERYKEYIRSLGTATNAMNSAIKKSIVAKNAVDTGRMKNTTFVKIVLGDDKKPDNIIINTTDYYKFVDEGTRYISPREITQYFMNTDTFKRELKRVASKWAAWQVQKDINEGLNKF